MKEITESEKAIITKYDLYFEGRLSKLESTSESLKNDMREVKSDLRWIIGIMLAGFSSLFGIMIHALKIL